MRMPWPFRIPAPPRACAGVQVVKECSTALQWLQDKQQLQAQLRPTEDPVLVHTDINKKNETLSRVCHPVTSKPAPAPPAVRLTPLF